jgi:hypothetical protein
MIMRKAVLILALLALVGNIRGGVVGLPREHVALPVVQGDHLICIWDETAGAWLKGFERYNHAGSYSFQLPQWGRWYWIGLWDESAGRYVFGKWIGHFITE